MAKLEGSDAEKILKKAGEVFGGKGFIGTDFILLRSASRNAVSSCNGNMNGIIR